ncbi:MAG: membrane protein insertase YidC, partial [Deltaproteobacteria bacterium]|nr:membrane protein insertase YidC [Deltaproteobacteria bacterium]
MDLQRLFLFLIFSFSLVLVWDGWQRYQHPDRFVPATEAISTSKVSAKKETIPLNSLPEVRQSQGVNTQQSGSTEGRTIKVKTDLVEAEISTVGGDIRKLALLKHPDSLDKTKPIILFEKGEGTHNYVAQTGLLGEGLPNHNSLFSADRGSYELLDNEDQLQVRLKSLETNRIKATKIITFHKASYLIDIDYELENTGNQTVSTSPYFQFIRDSQSPRGSSKFLPTYTGGAVYTEQEKFQKIDFNSIEKGSAEYPKKVEDGWIGMLQHYFVSAWLPPANVGREYFSRKLDGDSYSIGLVQQEIIIEPGKKAHLSSRLYAGPAKTGLDKIAPGLGLTVDYGWLTVIATPLFWVMTHFNDWTHNWGIAIILLTVLIKLIFFPLSAASYRSMAKMRLVAPK